MYGAQRPAVLGGIAVAGIVIAGLSALASLLTAGYGAGVYASSHAARDRFLRGAPVALPVASPVQPTLMTTAVIIPVGPNGLEAGQRAALIDAISQKIQMAPEQAQQLDALLAETGAKMFGATEAEAVTPQAVLDAIGDHFGLLPAISSNSAEPFYFETAAGRAEVFTDRALFYRKNVLSPIRASAGRRANVSGHPVLLPQDVEATIGLVQEAVKRGTSKSSSLNDAQIETLRRLLSEPKQQLVSIVPGPEGPTIGIAGASLSANGFATIEFSGGPVLLGPGGNVILQSDRDAFPVVNGPACLLVAIEGIVSIGLAVFLLVISLKLMNNPRQTLGPFRWFAFAKLAVAVGGAFAIGLMTYSFLMSAVRVGQSSAGAMSTAILVTIAFAIAGAAFPTFLLIVSRNRRVREYYET